MINVLLTTSKTLVLDLDPSKDQPGIPSCSLQWLNKQLLVKPTPDTQDTLPALKHREWLKKCLQNSIVEEVYLDVELGETGIKLWADVCRESRKKVFLDISSERKTINEEKLIYLNFKKIMNWWVAGILLLLCSPLMLILAIWVKNFNPDSILVDRWRVGNKGKLFKIYKFRTTLREPQQQLSTQKKNPIITFLGKWSHKFNLEKLPQLFNILQGEMGLFGSSTQTLSDALALRKRDDSEVSSITGALVLK